ncbi:MAG: LysM peptidoglycan-binding domain-containing protein [Betaproteobacteria bacterium]|nr:LysM peptidoglycan-binding domain-containing protein [Betaproteobacteria bacterium]
MAVLAGCAQAPNRPAPVEDRRSSAISRATTAASSTAAAANPAALPGADNAGKPGYYTVRPGDTLIKIGLDQGQNWRDLVRWNNLDNPNVIEKGQVLRVAPPPGEESVVVRPVARNNVTMPPPPGQQPPQQPAQQAPQASGSPPPPGTAPAAAEAAEDSLNFMWPATGQVLASFDDPKNKGIDLAGKAGDAVMAAADGRVVYAGSGLRGYGNLVIIKHNNVFLTAYAHNQSLLVKEDQVVKRGQKIAEMGNTDTDQVKLHFEIRRQGKPVDPARYLPTTR